MIPDVTISKQPARLSSSSVKEAMVLCKMAERSAIAERRSAIALSSGEPIWRTAAAVAAMAAWEYMGLAEKTGANPPRIAVLVAILALFAGSSSWPDQTVTILGSLSLGLLVGLVRLHLHLLLLGLLLPLEDNGLRQDKVLVR